MKEWPKCGCRYDGVPCEQQYRDAVSWADLINVSRRFIRGQNCSTMNHGAPLNEESAILVPRFLEMHEYGMLTTQSQPGLQCICRYENDEGDKWYEQKQRA